MLKLVDYLPVQTHKPNNNIHLCFCIEVLCISAVQIKYIFYMESVQLRKSAIPLEGKISVVMRFPGIVLNCFDFYVNKFSVKYFTDRSKAILLLWIFMGFFSVLCLLYFVRALWPPAWKGLTSWLSFVVSICEFFTFPLVS